MKNLRKKGWILNEKLKFKKVIEWMKSWENDLAHSTIVEEWQSSTKCPNFSSIVQLFEFMGEKRRKCIHVLIFIHRRSLDIFFHKLDPLPQGTSIHCETWQSLIYIYIYIYIYMLYLISCLLLRSKKKTMPTYGHKLPSHL
jgi:hypothetical protein